MSRPPRRHWGWWAVGIVAAILLFANQGFRQMVRLLRERQRLRQSVASLRQENQRLAHELSLIQQDPDYAEYLIRRGLGYVKKGEVEYRFFRTDKSSADRAQGSGNSTH
jgi:cell division protein FtsB